MSRSFALESWTDGDLLAPDEPNAEVDALVAEINGHLDKDNIDAALITGAKVALDTFHGILWIDDSGPDAIVGGGTTSPNDWQVLESGTLTTDDSEIEVIGSCTYDSASVTPPAGLHGELGVRIDGDIVARTGSSSWFESDSLWCEGMLPVGPGAHTIQLVYRVLPGEYDGGPPASLTHTVNGRSLWAREVAR